MLLSNVRKMIALGLAGAMLLVSGLAVASPSGMPYQFGETPMVEIIDGNTGTKITMGAAIAPNMIITTADIVASLPAGPSSLCDEPLAVRELFGGYHEVEYYWRASEFGAYFWHSIFDVVVLKLRDPLMTTPYFDIAHPGNDFAGASTFIAGDDNLGTIIEDVEMGWSLSNPDCYSSYFGSYVADSNICTWISYPGYGDIGLESGPNKKFLWSHDQDGFAMVGMSQYSFGYTYPLLGTRFNAPGVYEAIDYILHHAQAQEICVPQEHGPVVAVKDCEGGACETFAHGVFVTEDTIFVANKDLDAKAFFNLEISPVDTPETRYQVTKIELHHDFGSDFEIDPYNVAILRISEAANVSFFAEPNQFSLTGTTVEIQGQHNPVGGIMISTEQCATSYLSISGLQISGENICVDDGTAFMNNYGSVVMGLEAEEPKFAGYGMWAYDSSHPLIGFSAEAIWPWVQCRAANPLSSGQVDLCRLPDSHGPLAILKDCASGYCATEAIGVFISPTKILVADQELEGKPLSDFKVFPADDPTFEYTLKNYNPHPLYGENTPSYNDPNFVGVFEIEETAPTTPVQPINAVAYDVAEVHDLHQTISGAAMDNDHCQVAYNSVSGAEIRPFEFCVENYQYESTNTYGAPILIDGQLAGYNMWTAISGGHPAGFPMVGLRIDYLWDWIDSNI